MVFDTVGLPRHIPDNPCCLGAGHVMDLERRPVVEYANTP